MSHQSFSIHCVPYTQIDSSIYCQSWWWNEFCHICLNLNNAPRQSISNLNRIYSHLGCLYFCISQLRDEGAMSSCFSYLILTLQSQWKYCNLWEIGPGAYFQKISFNIWGNLLWWHDTLTQSGPLWDRKMFNDEITPHWTCWRYSLIRNTAWWLLICWWWDIIYLFIEVIEFFLPVTIEFPLLFLLQKIEAVEVIHLLQSDGLSILRLWTFQLRWYESHRQLVLAMQ